MSTSVTITPNSYTVPAVGERSWGDNVSDLLIALAAQADKVAQNTFVVSSDFTITDGAGLYGVKANFYKGNGNIASDGFLRMAHPDDDAATIETKISWRNTGNSADLELKPKAGSDVLLEYAGIDLADISTAQTYTNKTLTSPVLDTSVSGTAVLDEDDMVSDSDTQLATQQSIKKYVDDATAAQDEFTELTDTPANYTSSATKVVRVNAGETALEFVDTLTLVGLTTSGDLLANGAFKLDDKSSAFNLTIESDDIISTVPLTADRKLTIDVSDGDRNLVLTTDFGVETTARLIFQGGPATPGTFQLPTDTTSGFLLTRSSTDTVENKTFTSAVLNTSVTGTAVLDDDTFATASATTIATSESIKAYVDSQVGSATLLGLTDTPGAYTAQTLKVLRVNAGETAVEFTDLTGIAGYVANEHIDHTGVSITTATNSGLTGGGDITASRELDFDVNDMSVISGDAEATDTVPIYDGSGTTTGKVSVGGLSPGIDHDTLTNTHNLTTDIDHDQTTNFVANEHIDWTAATDDFATTGSVSTDKEIIAKQIATPANPSAGDNKLYFKSDNSLYSLTSAGVEAEIGSGGGGGAGEINYIDNFDAEDGTTTGWAGYDDGAVDIPVDGTGGSATNLAFSNQTGTILRGTRSFKIVKDTADAQGEGHSYDFTIDEADKNKLLKIEFDYETSAAYTDGALTVYIIGDTGGTPYVITPSSTDIIGFDTSLSGSGKMSISWTSQDDDDYRLCFHCTDSSATFWEFFGDNIIVGPGKIVTGAAVGPWTTYTPSNTQGFGTITGNNLEWARFGESMFIRGDFSTGTVAASEGQLELPDSLTIGGTATNTVEVGRLEPAASIGDYRGHLLLATKGDTYLNVGYHDSSASTYDATAPSNISGFLGNSQRVSIVTGPIPIAEWVGSGTVNLGANDVEYASNSDLTADLHDTSNFQYGSYGALFANNTVTVRKRVRFSNIQDTDRLQLEIFAIDNWLPVEESFLKVTSSTTGAMLERVSETDIDVYFGSAGFGATPSSGSGAWSIIDNDTDYRWRVVKHRAGIPVGFGQATATNSGLAKMNTDATTNNVGEYEEGTWTPSEDSKNNLTGTGVFGTATYTRIGNTVFARITKITGYSATSTGATSLIINTTGLPGVVNTTTFYGSASWASYEACAILNNTDATTDVFMGLLVTTTGANTFGSINFSYVI